MFDLEFHNTISKISKYILDTRKALTKQSEDQRISLIRGNHNDINLFKKDTIFYEYVNEWSKYFEYREFMFRKRPF